MTNPQLFPKPRKRLRQPSKKVMRDELRRAADRIIELQEENEALKFYKDECFAAYDELAKTVKPRRPWWKRINWRKVG